MVENTKESTYERSPVVVVMGHVDHGKTALLDHIRKTNVIDKEAGGITQSIGAYEIEHNEKKLTFIDTPGHEAFFHMRQRGATVADLAILVIAADEGVKPQTQEAIRHIKDSGIPYIIAFNKMDKPNIDVQRIKGQLAENEVFVEGMGGDVSFQEISAKTGQGVEELLDLLLIAAELEDLSYDPQTDGRGVVIEAEVDPRRGNTVSAVVQDGVVKQGDEVATQTAEGRVRIMEDFLGNTIKTAHPSSPILIVGFETLPNVGEEFIVGGKAQKKERLQNVQKEVEGSTDQGVFKVMVRADVAGSAEALAQLLQTLDKEHVRVDIVEAEVGDITDSVVNMAIAAGAMIAGFNVRVQRGAHQLAENNRVSIITSNIIYEVLQGVEKAIEAAMPKPPTGRLKILANFRSEGNRQVIGGEVVEGFIKNGADVELHRGERTMGEGKIVNLQTQKKDADQVDEGSEAGLLYEGSLEVRKGDELWYFE